ncbi:MAG: hypothetical protein PHW76_01370 [Alphaproteobacteria bacterium]|nr:hypothetical protein [Alphaproteobacteria bacterium]
MKKIAPLVFALSFGLAACTKQEVVDSTGASLRSWCKTQPNCTVNDDRESR